jgi:arsenate reductase (thioredoxin)
VPSAALNVGTMRDVVNRHRVLFVCVQNAGRSQIAEAMFNALGGSSGEARSAGTRPAGEVHPHVAAALADRGFDVAQKTPHRLSVDDAEWANIVVTMGCGDECPVTGKPTEDWELPDPKTMSASDLTQLIDEIGVRVADLFDRLDRKTARD